MGETLIEALQGIRGHVLGSSAAAFLNCDGGHREEAADVVCLGKSFYEYGKLRKKLCIIKGEKEESAQQSARNALHFLVPLLSSGECKQQHYDLPLFIRYVHSLALSRSAGSAATLWSWLITGMMRHTTSF